MQSAVQGSWEPIYEPNPEETQLLNGGFESVVCANLAYTIRKTGEVHLV